MARAHAPEDQRDLLLQGLSDLTLMIPSLGDMASKSLETIDLIFQYANIIPITDGVKLKAAQRAIDRHAPFHRRVNGMNDAVILESYAELTARPDLRGHRFAFITHNKHDFSDPTDERIPHPHIAHLFSKRRSLYLTTLGDALKRIAPDDIDWMLEEIEDDDYARMQRSIYDVLRADAELTEQLWYGRHLRRAQALANGEIKLVDRADWSPKRNDHVIVRDVWEQALKAAERVKARYGPENLGHWTDFEWGMLCGKISALRWTCGDEWDNLDA